MNTATSRTWRLAAILFVLCLLAAGVYAAPAELNQSVTYNGQTITLHMHLETVRGPYFEVKVQNSTGGYDTYTPGEVRTYIGTVNEYPEAWAAGVLQADSQLRARVYFDRGKTWYTLAGSVYSTLGMSDSVISWPSTPTVAAGRSGGSTMYGFDVGVDCDNRYYVVCGSTVATTLERVEFTMACDKTEYMMDAKLRPYLARVIIRAVAAKDPYNTTTGTALLDKLKTEWDTNQTDATRTLAGLATTSVGGGVAWGNSIGTAYAYCANDTDSDGNFDQVFRHEMGHSWNVDDMQANYSEGPTIDNGNQYGRFSGPELEVLLVDRNGHTGLLRNEGTYTANNLPPYSALDTVEASWAVNAQAYTIDVMANDFDSNGHTLNNTIPSFESTSIYGCTVTRSAGSGPGGRDQLVYTSSPNVPANASDSFMYKIQDSSAQSQTGAAVVGYFLRNDLKGYWPLNETSGITAPDISQNNVTGTVEGTGTWAAGKFGNALAFNGTDTDVIIPALNIQANTFTVTAWIKRNGNQIAWSGIFICSSGDTRSGLLFGGGTANELRYMWNGGSEYNWGSGLIVPDATWTFVALVVDPAKATIYMNSGGSLQSAVHTVAQNVMNFGGPSYLGLDPNQSTRRYKGTMDEVRVYDQALTLAQITALSTGPTAATSPFPRNATTVGPREMTWVGCSQAVKYIMYFGTNQTAVQNATPSSAECLGVTTKSSWYPAPTMNNGTTYYWRVDTELSGGTVLAGPVWNFVKATTPPSPSPYGDWKLDEGTGTNAADSSGNGFNGTVRGATWVTGYKSNALQFDGSNDDVQLPALNVPRSNGVTITAWVKRNGNVPAWAPIFFNRDPVEGAAGLGFGDANELRYHWSDWYWDFNSGLVVPDATWTFVALVVESSKATFYMNSGGGMQTAVSNGGHGPYGFKSTAYLGWDSNFAARRYNGQMDEVRIYKYALQDIDIQSLYTGYAGNHAPGWNANPIVEPNATPGTPYSGTIADHASDVDGDPLKISKVSGPAWLTVAATGALSGTPGAGDTGLNSWTVRVTDSFGASSDATLQITVAVGPATYYPSSYAVVQGSYVSGNVASLVSDDNNYLVIASQTSGTTRYATTDFTVTGITVPSPSKITVQVIAKSSRSSTTQRIKLWNYSTSAWDQKDSVTISTSEVTRSFDVTTGASSYISGGQLKVETNDSHGSKQSFNASHEVVSVTITP